MSHTPSARLTFSTNDLPTFVDTSEGIWRRLIVLPFFYQVPEEKRDPSLVDKLKDELPGIFNWGIEGARQLMGQRSFSKSSVTKRTVDQHREFINSSRRFLKEFYAEGTGYVRTASVYYQYREWCREEGEDPQAAGPFGKELRRVYPRIEKKSKRIKGKKTAIYVGMVELGPMAVEDTIEEDHPDFLEAIKKDARKVE